MSCIAYTEDGEELYLDAIWDYSGIDIQTVGAYKITGTVRLPEGYTSNVGLPEWTAWILYRIRDSRRFRCIPE